METNKVILIIHGPATQYKSVVISGLQELYFPEFAHIDGTSDEDEIAKSLANHLIIDVVNQKMGVLFAGLEYVALNIYIDCDGEIPEDNNHISFKTDFSVSEEKRIYKTEIFLGALILKIQHWIVLNNVDYEIEF